VPACVVAPGSLEELAAVMRVAHEQRAAVAAWGGGTQQQIGNPPAQLDLVVRTERLNCVLIYEPDDLTISVEAGMTIGTLREIVARYGQMFADRPAAARTRQHRRPDRHSDDGPRRLGYGTLRELTIGIAVVEASGRISRGGGMVVKNVSGFDMMKLYMGSLGTLAIIASANFKLQPIPRAGSHAPVPVRRRGGPPSQRWRRWHLTQLTPTATEYLNDRALAHVVSTEKTQLNRWAYAAADQKCALALRAEGLPAAVERHIADMTALATRNGASDCNDWMASRRPSCGRGSPTCRRWPRSQATRR